MDDSTFTLEKFQQAVGLIKNLQPDPLTGLTHIYYAKNMADAARQIASAICNASTFGMLRPRPITLLSEHLPLGYMVGTNAKGEVVLLGGPPQERKPKPENPWAYVFQTAIS